MKKILCKMNIHRWGKPKQWVRKDGEVVVAPRCLKCGMLKGDK